MALLLSSRDHCCFQRFGVGAGTCIQNQALGVQTCDHLATGPTLFNFPPLLTLPTPSLKN